MLRTFHELWFAQPAPADGGAAPADGTTLSPEVCASRCDMLIGVVTRSGGGSGGSQRTEWLASILGQLLCTEGGAEPAGGGGGNVGGASSLAGAREAAGAVRVCEQLVGQLVEALVQVRDRGLNSISASFT